MVLHWGPDLGDAPGDALAEALVPAAAHSAIDRPVRRRLLPMPADGWRLRPGLAGARPDGSGWSPRFLVRSVEVTGDGTCAEVAATDPDAGLDLVTRLRLHPSGVLEAGHTLRNLGDGPYLVSQLAVSLPLPARAVELLDLTGRWCRERIPQRHPLPHGAWVREGRHGRTGHDATLVLAAGSPGFGFRSGEVWGVHLGWSGDAVHWAERNADGHAGIGAAELLGPSRWPSAPAIVCLPAVYATYSADGLDGLSAAYRFLRDRPTHPRTPARSCSTPGRPSTSTTAWNGSPTWPTWPPASGSSGSCSTTAGSATAAATPPASATGTSPPTSGRTASTR